MKLTPAQRRILAAIDQGDAVPIHSMRGNTKVLKALHVKGLIRWALGRVTGRELTSKGKEALANA